MNVREAIITRQSCRSFDGTRNVEQEKLQQIVDAGVLSPSARNSQPWLLTVVSGNSARKIADICQIGGANGFLQDCNTFIVVSMKDRINVVMPEGLTVQDYRPMDIGMCVMQMCLCATELGVDTCIIGRFNSQQIADIVGVDKPVALVLAVGYQTEGYELREKKRNDVAETVKYICD